MSNVFKFSKESDVLLLKKCSEPVLAINIVRRSHDRTNVMQFDGEAHEPLKNHSSAAYQP